MTPQWIIFVLDHPELLFIFGGFVALVGVIIIFVNWLEDRNQ